MEARGEPTAVRGIVGRDTELAAIRNFLEQDDPCAAALVMTGDAGVGKTTLWRASTTLAAARGWRVLACRPAGAEVTASLSALADLLDPVLDDALPHLAEPQRRALEVALLRRADSRIHSVMVSGVAPACAGSSIDVILTKDGNRIAYGQGIANATTTTYMIAVNDGFGGQPSAEDINDVHVLIR